MLTDKQELFCQEYLIDLNQTKAYMRAFGVEVYSTAASEASKLAKTPIISARIRELMAERVERLNINQDWVLLSLLDIRNKSARAEPVLKFNYKTKQMEETGEYVYDSNGANKATELIGKHMGMFKDKVEHSGEIQGFQIVIGDSTNQNSQPG